MDRENIQKLMEDPDDNVNIIIRILHNAIPLGLEAEGDQLQVEAAGDQRCCPKVWESVEELEGPRDSPSEGNERETQEDLALYCYLYCYQ